MDGGHDRRLVSKPAFVDADAPRRRSAAMLADLVPLLARLAGAATAEEGARALLAGLREAFGAPFGGEVAIAAPRLDVIATLEAAPDQAHLPAAAYTILWADGDREVGQLVARGLTERQRDRLIEWAAWLQPTITRLADARLAAAAGVQDRRRALAWRLRGDVLALAQEPTNAEAYLHRVVALVARQLRGLQVVFWRYVQAGAGLEACCASSERLDLPVPGALFQEVIAQRQPRTAALPDRSGSLRTCVLAPVFDGDALVGVFQLVPKRPALDPGLENAMAAIATATATGLRTVGAFERLTFQASHDPLTGLANRRTFEAFINREIKLSERHGSSLSVVVVDADHFKRYNDTYGHEAGDALLKALAGRLGQVVRSTDFVARYGGEEFVIVLPHTDRGGALAAANKVIEGIRSLPEQAEVRGGRFTASLGVATYPGDVFDARELFNAADQALYRAKHLGRDRVCQAGD